MEHDRGKEFAFELKRKLFHFVLGVVIAGSVYVLYPFYQKLLLIPLVIAIVVMRATPRLPIDHYISKQLLYHFERERDRKHFPFKGAIFFGIGIIPPLVLLPVDLATGRPLLACAVISVLAGGDAFATLVGKFYGKYRVGHKSVEGFIAFVVFSYMMASLFVDHKTAFALAFIGAIIEFFNTIDDNLAIPIVLTVIIEIANAIAPGVIFRV
jgi:phytol kinase